MKKLLFTLFIILTIFACIPQQSTVVPEVISDPMAMVLPVDPNVIIGKLDNGLTYYIRKNTEPEQRAELRLAVNAGSVMENDNQQGLAHLLEHMAFNGTANFKKQELVDYLESIGTKFGPDLNAYTSFDETVYMLKVPTDSVEQFSTAFQILEDWAHSITLDPDEIDKERGVVQEEWRLRRGAEARMRDKQFPILFKDSQYAVRLPIGQFDVIDTAHYETITQFYTDWYRPNLMAVIAIGDFDVNWVEDKIITHFNKLSNPENELERTLFNVPDHEEGLVAIATDPEATSTSVSVYLKRDVEETTTLGDYRNQLVTNLFSGMLNSRLEERTREPNPPYMYGFTGQGRFVRTKNVVYLGAGVQNDKIVDGLTALLVEVERSRQHGFADSELSRQKTESLKWIEKSYKDRENQSSRSYTSEYIRNFLSNEAIPGIENEFEYYKKLLPSITLDEVNAVAKENYSNDNRVLLVNAPEKEDITIPSEAELLVLFDKVAGMDIEPYQDEVSDEPLVTNPPNPGKVVNEALFDNVGIVEWTLSNGAKVQYKITDFKNDEILFGAQSPGGHSLVPDEKYTSAITATSIVSESGLGSFDLNSFQKKLSGKIVSVSPYISELQEGLRGSCSPDDLETLMQLIYLMFTEPRADSVGYNAYVQRMQGWLENRSSSPESAYRDTASVTLANYHFRSRPWTVDRLDEIDLEDGFSAYLDRFKDASDFTFFFVGNVDVEAFRVLAEKYIGGLPAINREETWLDVGRQAPEGTVIKAVHRGTEPKSLTQLSFTSSFEWTPYNDYILGASIQAMRIKLREVLREDQSGTYGVRLSGKGTHFPNEKASVTISFGADPERVDELTEIVFAQIDSLKEFGLTDKYVNKVIETHRRERETKLKENGYWLGVMKSYDFNERAFSEFEQYDEWIGTFSNDHIKQTANNVFTDRYVRVTLYPEKE